MEAPRFTYNPIASESQPSFSGILEIYVHHARNIHNICIYDNQDVYAKFSLTYNPDYTLSTTIINRGGKNPEFNEELIIQVNQMDAVLKCEIWMLSRAKNFMDDQLLGFALVPVSSVLGKGKVTQDFTLSSTDLFHSPAGTIKLSLSLTANTPLNPNSLSFASLVFDASATSELLVDKNIPQEYSSIEFPDINIVSENQEMVSQYFDFTKNEALLRPWLEKPDGSFLHLGSIPPPRMPVEDCEMGGNSSESYRSDSTSQNGSIQDSGLSEDQNPAEVSTSVHGSRKSGGETQAENEHKFLSKGEESRQENVNLETEEGAMQQQIVDMYMRSMHQFTDSLAKMKLPMDLGKPQLPMDLDKPRAENVGDSKCDESVEKEKKNKKDGSRVFYGSRAFF